VYRKEHIYLNLHSSVDIDSGMVLQQGCAFPIVLGEIAQAGKSGLTYSLIDTTFRRCCINTLQVMLTICRVEQDWVPRPLTMASISH
jgi:hypothetical protein